MKHLKKTLGIILAGVLIFSFAGCGKKDEPITEPSTPTTTTTAPPVYYNPYTGEEGYNKKAVGKRPVAIVVENQYYARPQWGLNSPDIIIEGEVEGGISRMLWVYADYTDVPDKVGPTRSARPSYVKSSKFFDAVFIHWGGSGSDGAYVGGYDTIKNESVDDIDGIAGGEMFGRDNTRSVDLEHRGVVYGNKIPGVLKSKNIRTDTQADKYTTFEFNEKDTPLSESVANTVKNKFGGSTDTRTFTYSSQDKKYHTSDWQDDTAFKNLIILKAVTNRYTVGKKGTTYVNYDFSSGTGYIASLGTKKAIKWSVKDKKKLVITDEEGNSVKLNVGRSYIGYCSGDDGGNVSFGE